MSFSKQVPSNALENESDEFWLLKKSKKKNTQRALVSEIKCKSNYHQETLLATRLMRNITHKRKREQATLAKRLDQWNRRIQCEKTISYAHASRHFTSELDKTSDMWGLNQYNRKRNTQNLIYFSFNIHY